MIHFYYIHLTDRAKNGDFGFDTYEYLVKYELYHSKTLSDFLIFHSN